MIEFVLLVNKQGQTRLAQVSRKIKKINILVYQF